MQQALILAALSLEDDLLRWALLRGGDYNVNEQR